MRQKGLRGAIIEFLAEGDAVRGVLPYSHHWAQLCFCYPTAPGSHAVCQTAMLNSHLGQSGLVPFDIVVLPLGLTSLPAL